MTVTKWTQQSLTGADAAAKEAGILEVAGAIGKSVADAHAAAEAYKAALGHKDAAVKEAALVALASLATPRAAAFFLHLLAPVLELVADNKVAAAAKTAAAAIVKSADPLAVKLVLPQIAASLSIKSKWQTKVVALECLKSLTTTSTTQVSAPL